MNRKFDLVTNFFSNISPYIKEKSVIGVSCDKEISFSSIKETEDMGFTSSAVSDCCRGTRKSHKGFVWNFRKNRE